VQSAADELGWPASAIHYEAFSAPAPGKPFVAELKRTGKRIEVGSDESLLEALEAAEVDIQSSCRGGVCGRCMTPLIDGQADHRDQFLSDDEKARQDCVMPCVSRAQNDKLVLDL
jgi:ferredoxin